VVLVECADYLRKVFARERLAPGEDEHAEVSAQSLRDATNLVGLHLQLLARAVVQLVREEAVRAAHVAHARHQYVQKHRREGLAHGQLRVSLQKLSCRVVHYDCLIFNQSRSPRRSPRHLPALARPLCGTRKYSHETLHKVPTTPMRARSPAPPHGARFTAERL